MFGVPLEKPSPDWETFERVLRGETRPERVRFVELLMDEEVKKNITENFLGKRWVAYSPDTREEYLLQDVNFWHRMGYDYIRVTGGGEVSLSWPGKIRETEDTAVLSRGKRHWAEEGRGIIGSWEDFEKYLWPEPEKIDYSPYEFTSKHLPEGMGMLVCPSSGVFEVASGSLLGLENMAYLLADDPALVEAVFDRVGRTIFSFYRNVVELDNVKGFFQGDDMGYNTATMVAPAVLRKLVLPWHKKFAELAHRNGQMYWFHCCGNVLEIMEEVIDDIEIDAFHSFQDVIIPIGEFVKRYGDRVAALGGVDMDNLARMREDQLRKYVRKTLRECMPGRFALGSGNSITNYIPPTNYLAMLDEGLKWTA